MSEFVGSTPLIARVLDEADRAAKVRHPTLIIGETGTGKELLARRIHAGVGPFVVIDCTHLREELAERELFGHVKGAFTGAVTDSPGLIAAAHNGVAFFDEIGELPLAMQSKLLRVLQDNRFRPVGSVREQYSEFRVIAATNRDLKQEAKAGRFRLDLYQRLNVIKLCVPPLRERGEDIPKIIAYYCQQWQVRLSSDALAVLCAYSWPGNVRELENVIKRASALATGHDISASDLPLTVYDSRQPRSGLQPSEVVGSRSIRGENDDSIAGAAEHRGAIEGVDVTECLAEVETRAILQALAATNGNRKAAAMKLRIGRSTLHRRISNILSEGRSEAKLLQAILGRKMGMHRS
jgi:DNA-binding NtrC family response regulator